MRHPPAVEVVVVGELPCLEGEEAAAAGQPVRAMPASVAEEGPKEPRVLGPAGEEEHR